MMPVPIDLYRPRPTAHGRGRTKPPGRRPYLLPLLRPLEERHAGRRPGVSRMGPTTEPHPTRWGWAWLALGVLCSLLAVLTAAAGW